MWIQLAWFILRFRRWIIFFFISATAFMGYHAQHVRLYTGFIKVIPESHPTWEEYTDFEQAFGSGNNVLAVGLKDSAVFQMESFRNLWYLSRAISKLPDVQSVEGIPSYKALEKDSPSRSFVRTALFPHAPSSQSELDEKLALVRRDVMFSTHLLNLEESATFLLVFFDPDIIETPRQNVFVEDLIHLCEEFEQEAGIQLNLAGMCYQRTLKQNLILSDIGGLTGILLAITALILLLYFRNWRIVAICMFTFCAYMLWVFGIISILGFQINILTSLIPPLVIVIGVPNCVYFVNKYYAEMRAHQTQFLALAKAIQKIGFITFCTNLTTSLGFIALMSINIPALREFGLVASMNILGIFLLSALMIPSLFSFIPAPSVGQVRSSELKPVARLLSLLQHLALRRRRKIFLVAIVFALVGLGFLLRIDDETFVVENLKPQHIVKRSLAFFDENFGGILPLEVVIDTKEKNGVRSLDFLKKIDGIEKQLQQVDGVSSPLSNLTFLKSARQGFYNNASSFYDVPTSRELPFLAQYLKNTPTDSWGSVNFVDSLASKMRISLRIADNGSTQVEQIVQGSILPIVSEAFDEDKKVDFYVTGTPLMNMRSNDFLVNNIGISFLITLCLMAVIMALLFRKMRMVVISIIPNIIPLIMTAGFMGIFGIRLTPSTALIFSMVFGISVDDSIHFLSRYRLDLIRSRFQVEKAVTKCLRETGTSMIYSSVALFLGFAVFLTSQFTGTIMIGLLTMITLLMALATNVILLPSLLLRFDRKYEPWKAKSAAISGKPRISRILSLIRSLEGDKLRR